MTCYLLTVFNSLTGVLLILVMYVIKMIMVLSNAVKLILQSHTLKLHYIEN